MPQAWKPLRTPFQAVVDAGLHGVLRRQKAAPQDDNVVSAAGDLPLGLYRFFFADAFADFEFHLAGFLVGVDDDVVAVQDLSI